MIGETAWSAGLDRRKEVEHLALNYKGQIARHSRPPLTLSGLAEVGQRVTRPLE